MLQKTPQPVRGMALRRSTRLRPGSYQFNLGEDEPAITVRAEDAVIDCTGVELRGVARDAASFRGVGLRVLNSKRVTIRGLSVSGFHIGVHVLRSSDVVIEGVEACRMRRRRPGADEAEDPRAWLDLFDKATWREYGCGIWYERSSGGAIVHCRARESQEGINLDKSDGVLVLGNDCGRNAGWGVHLDRASECAVVSNACRRCQYPAPDSLSAGVVLNNGCHDNRVLANDLTHCTRGVLVAGDYNEQSNGNLVAHNDASHALLAGYEARFVDRCQIRSNVANDAPIGVRIESCREAVIAGNTLGRCAEAAVLVVHGSRARIEGNALREAPVGVRLTSANGARRPAADCRIASNVVAHVGLAAHLESAHRTLVRSNRLLSVGRLLECTPECFGTTTE